MRCARFPGARRQHEHEQGDRKQRRARLEWRVAEHDLQVHDQQKERPAQRRVQDERHDVGRGEQPRGEDVERQHRMPATRFGEEEADDAADPDERGGHDRRRRDSPARPFDERIGHPRESRRRRRARRRRRCRRAIEGSRRLRHVPNRDRDRDRHQRQVEQKDHPPRHGIDEPSTRERPDRRGHAPEARPRADGAGPILSPK